MKVDEKKTAILLRKKGVSLGDIAKQLGVAKSSVSYWVRDVELSESQKKRLNKNGHSIEAIEKRRQSRMQKTSEKRKEIFAAAKLEVAKLKNNPLWCIGISLYWGEGGKTQNIARLANSDPDVIKVMMRFFREVCGVSEAKFRGHIHTFEHCNEKIAESYWESVSGIPTSRFFKTYKKQSSASKKKRNTLPNGTFQVYVHDTDLFFRIMGWIEGVKEMSE